MEKFLTALSSKFKSVPVDDRSLWKYPVIHGISYSIRREAVHRFQQSGHLVDAALMMIGRWQDESQNFEGPRFRQLKEETLRPDQFVQVQSSSASLRQLVTATLLGSRCIMIVPLYCWDRILSLSDNEPVAFFICGDQHCVTVNVDFGSSWTGIKDILEDDGCCKVMIAAANELPLLMLASQSLEPRNIFCLTTMHRELCRLTEVPDRVSGCIPSFHVFYGVKYRPVSHRGNGTADIASLIKYSLSLRTVLLIWQNEYRAMEEFKSIFHAGYRWNIKRAVRNLVTGHKTVLPTMILVWASQMVIEKRSLLAGLLASALVAFRHRGDEWEERARGMTVELEGMLNQDCSQISAKEGMHSDIWVYLKESVGLINKGIMPCETLIVGSLGDVLRRLKFVAPNYCTNHGIIGDAEMDVTPDP